MLTLILICLVVHNGIAKHLSLSRELTDALLVKLGKATVLTSRNVLTYIVLISEPKGLVSAGKFCHAQNQTVLASDRWSWYQTDSLHTPDRLPSSGTPKHISEE